LKKYQELHENRSKSICLVVDEVSIWFVIWFVKIQNFFLQNIWKNRFLTNIILENNKNFNIIFIQEISWSTIQTIPSSPEKEGEQIVGTPNHPFWITFSRNSVNNNEHPKVLIYINIQLIQLCFSLRKDIINYRNINLIFFFDNSIICFIINIYSNKQQSALKYLKDIEVNLNNVLIMMKDFNIRDIDWDPSYPYHSVYISTFIKIADFGDLSLFTPISQVSTKYTNQLSNWPYVSLK